MCYLCSSLQIKYSILQSHDQHPSDAVGQRIRFYKFCYLILTYKKAAATAPFVHPPATGEQLWRKARSPWNCGSWLSSRMTISVRPHLKLQTTQYCASLYHPLTSRRSLGLLRLSRSAPYYKPINHCSSAVFPRGSGFAAELHCEQSSRL